MTNRTVRALKYFFGWPLSILALFFITKLIAPKIPQFLANIHNVNIGLLLSGMLCFITFYCIRGYIWHLLISAHSKNITVRESAYFWAISELKRYIPGNVWSFVGRTMLFSEKGVAKKDIGKLLFAEALLLVIGSATISLLALPFVASQLLTFISAPLLSLAVIGVLVLWGIYMFNHKFSKILPPYGPILNAFHLFLSSVALFLFGIGNYFVISSFVALPLQLVFELSGFFTLSFLIGYLSILTPAGFGVREGIVISGLSKITTISNSALAALFSRIVLIISELIFVTIIYLWYKSKNKTIASIGSFISKNKHELVLLICFLLYVLYFSLASFLRYDNFYAGRFDLGNMAQTVWNTTRGRVFVFTNPNGTEMMSRLAFHADFLLVLLAPIYAIVPNPKTLLFVQVFVVAAGSFFIYKIAKDKLMDKNISLVLAFAYLINPSVERATLYDFHAVTLATTFLLGTYYFYDKKKYVLFGVFAILAALCKEEIWLIIALFGALLCTNRKTRLPGVAIFLSSVTIFYYLISVAIPNALGAKHFALAYYSDFGDGPLTIIKSIILSPQKILHIILEKSRIDYLSKLFAPLGYLSLLFPFYLIFAFPDLLINLLSNNAQLHQIYYHYTAAISPFIFICAILGISVLRRYVPKITPVMLIVYLLFTSVLTAYQYGPLPGAVESNIDMFIKPLADREFIDKYLSSIPKRKSVASSNNIGSHLSQRQRIYTLPLGIDKADVIVFLLNDTESPQSINAEREQLKKIRNDKNYELIVERGLFSAFRKKTNL